MASEPNRVALPSSRASSIMRFTFCLSTLYFGISSSIGRARIFEYLFNPTIVSTPSSGNVKHGIPDAINLSLAFFIVGPPTSTPIIGFSTPSLFIDMSRSASSSGGRRAVGAIMEIMLKAFGSSRTVRSPNAYRFTSASPTTSTGLLTAASSGRFLRSLVIVSGESDAILSPRVSIASAVSTPGPPAFVTTTTLSPLGTGCEDSAIAILNSSPRE